MGMSEFYGAADEAESIATIHRALELGCTFLDTADMYGPLENLAAADITLTSEDLAWLEENVGKPAGDRYADMRTVNR
jgi:aryl-alcohol dehydrogenase-like predicted oxidoreductase